MISFLEGFVIRAFKRAQKVKEGQEILNDLSVCTKSLLHYILPTLRLT